MIWKNEKEAEAEEYSVSLINVATKKGSSDKGGILTTQSIVNQIKTTVPIKNCIMCTDSIRSTLKLQSKHMQRVHAYGGQIRR